MTKTKKSFIMEIISQLLPTSCYNAVESDKERCKINGRIDYFPYAPKVLIFKISSLSTLQLNAHF